MATPMTTLKLISNLCGLRGTKKSDKERFYTTALWLHKHHPKTLALNARTLAEFGYFKDLLNTRNPRRGNGTQEKDPKARAEHARSLRNQRVLDKAKKAFERYNRDPVYRFLLDTISDVFAKMLKVDMQALNAGKLKEISLAAKWCPTIDSTYDKSLLICESIARRVFPKESDPEYQTLEKAHYAYRVRDRLRKQVLVPLHKVWSSQGLRKISPTPPAQFSLYRQGNEALLCKPINTKQLTLQKMLKIRTSYTMEKFSCMFNKPEISMSPWMACHKVALEASPSHP
nr:hypothetical protein CFP56_25107 [Quercus suber]